ncbi:hypothetical protein GCM10010123_00160 [Pilimelia anulata]|uniref:Uncharacterized protein n=1 Tax=Pilimelia anulata TaxID=53371 RepID=A0A8J3B306_9ACTN|nr:hypothetical protein [Pilimelia anulata]GGJ74180.1 hypothetical protein GCM10010123_00160 [Pilimelia anulata]
MMTTATDLAAEALFVSDLQPSQQPTPAEVEAAVTAMVARYGTAGCAASCAAEFGDHPDTATRRMTWVRQVLLAVLASEVPRARG